MVSGWGTRHTVIAMGFWGFAMSYAMRVNLSIAIVAMVKRNATPTPPPAHLAISDYAVGNGTGAACPGPIHTTDVTVDTDDGEFYWDEVEQGIILGSFFYGYMLTQLPGGIISQKYGGKWPLGLGIFITAIFALLTPIAARIHVSLLIIARIIQGFGEVHIFNFFFTNSVTKDFMHNCNTATTSTRACVPRQCIIYLDFGLRLTREALWQVSLILEHHSEQQ